MESVDQSESASVIVVAAGQGLRLGADQPKQYLPLAGCPVLGWTLKAFAAAAGIGRMVAVVPPGDSDFCRSEILEPLGLTERVALVAGGGERQESVFNGLAALAPVPAVVLIHDGVRPLVTGGIIAAVLRGAREWGACIAALPVPDTIKRVAPEGRIGETLPRDGLWQAQTPQGFRFALIWQAHQEARRQGFRGTDDAQLVERLGHAVRVVPGSPGNVKITHPADLALAAALLKSVSS